MQISGSSRWKMIFNHTPVTSTRITWLPSHPPPPPPQHTHTQHTGMHVHEEHQTHSLPTLLASQDNRRPPPPLHPHTHTGIHDHPLTKKLQPATTFGPPSSAVNDSTRRYTPASTFGSAQRVRGASRDLLNTYKPLFHMTLGANISGSTYRLPPGLSVSAPNAGFIKAGASLRSSFDLPRGPTPASPRQSPRSPFGEYACSESGSW